MGTDRFAQELASYLALRALWNDDPARYCVERLGLKPTWQQRLICDAIAPDGARVSVVSGQNTGKDAIVAGLILWFMECKAFPRIPCTAPTAKQLYTILWAELSKWMRKAAELSERRGDLKRFRLESLFKLTTDMLVDISAPQDWFAVARTTSAHTAENLQGFHASDLDINETGDAVATQGAPNFLFILDEASGIPDEISAVVDGATASPGARELQIGNGNRRTGFFAVTHQRLGDTYKLISLKSAESPLCDPKFRPRMVKKFGADSDVVRVRCDGKFPKADPDTLIPYDICEPALRRPPPERAPREPLKLGIDCAWEGDDRSTFILRQGPLIPFIQSEAKTEPMAIVGYAMQIIQEWPVDQVFVDTIGIGAGVYSRLAELRRDRTITCQVIKVDVSEKAPERKFKQDVQCHLLRDYLGWECRRYFFDDLPSIPASDELALELIGEISSIRALPPDSNGYVRVESKKEYKKRNQQSPDLWDGLCCTFAPVTGSDFRYESVRPDSLDPSSGIFASEGTL